MSSRFGSTVAFAIALSTSTVAFAATVSSAVEPMVGASAPDDDDELTTPPAIAAPEPSFGGEGSAVKPHVRHDEKRFVVARDFGLVVPVGPLSDDAAAMYGPLLRLGYHVNDSVELGIRAAYLRGFDKEIAGVTGSLSSVPITASTRWFILGDRSGPYAGAEVGVNIFRQNRSARTSFWDVSADATWVRPSANLGVGFVWSRSLPIDLRGQVASLDLFGKGGPTSTLVVGVTAGWSFFF
ncbi:MAG: hypothetical protein K0S65_994 [Labilithrix sp.]|nr:hypothetical protein [Labilithrix sp.]